MSKLPPEDTSETPTRVDSGTLPTVRVMHSSLQQQIDAVEAATLRGMAKGEARSERLAEGEHAKGKITGLVLGIVLGVTVFLVGVVSYLAIRNWLVK